MNVSKRLDFFLLLLGLLIAAILLIRFAIDLSAEMPLLLSVPFWMLVLASLGVIGWNIFGKKKSEDAEILGQAELGFFLFAIPVAFIASSLDCTGLALAGCSPFCTFVKLAWVPMIAVMGGIYLFTRRSELLTLMLLMSFVPLVPHCVCYNAANGWWIDRIGNSPECYVWGFTVSLIAFGAIGRKAHRRISAAMIMIIIAGGIGFFVSHHYFHFPW